MAGFELSIYSLLLLGVLFIAYQTDKFLMDEKVKQLKKIMMVVAGLIIMDIVLVSLDGQHHFFANISLRLGNTLYYILSPLPSYFWLHYVLLFLYKDKQKIKRLLWIGVIILSVNVILSFINLQYPIYFSVDINNMYQRENGMIINSVFSYIMIVIASFFILKNSKKIRYQDLIALLFFMVPPTIANIVQTKNEGTLVVWPGIVFSLLVAFIYIQNKTMAKDYLSGLYNKMEFDQYLEYIISKKPSRGFVGLLIDINDFKFINDNYGHDAGDKVIHQIGILLKESFRANDLIARIGGDEFAVIAKMHHTHPSVFKNRILANLEQLNKKNTFDFELSLSIGYALWTKKENLDRESFFNKLDQSMYRTKKQMKGECDE